MPAGAARVWLAMAAAVAVSGCATRGAPVLGIPSRIISHATWQSQPVLGYAADAARRNLRIGDSLRFQDLVLEVVSVASGGAAPATGDTVTLRIASADDSGEVITLREGSAVNRRGVHIAVVAIYGPGELGAGLVALEVATIASLLAVVSGSETAGGAELRLRIPHRITHVTLHHTGSPEPLMPGEDPVARLRGLQAWGARDRNWWDVPYHYLIDLEGHVYEGRDWRYMGETNTTYDPAGHFLVSIIGNYELQEPTPAQLGAIADLMAWALVRFDLPIERVGGHYGYAETSCPGRFLRRYLEDGTLERMIRARLRR
jgi:hypothetical protein